MHNIYDCVDSFASLLDTEYYFVLGRKEESVSLNGVAVSDRQTGIEP